MDISELSKKINKFANERDWSQFHNPKDLATALSIEVAELQEIMLWTPTEKSAQKVEKQKAAVESEVGDIMIYLLKFCDVTCIDLIQAASNKLILNEERYPVDKAKGNSKKYTEF